LTYFHATNPVSETGYAPHKSDHMEEPVAALDMLLAANQ
jgi:hypothetical protein